MLLAKNRKALYNFEVIEKFMAGIVLHGYEVKAIREGKANLSGAHVRIVDNEVFVTNMYIGSYSKQSQEIDENKLSRDRKLLLKKNEIEKLQRAIQQKGKTAVPLALLLRKNMIKLEFAVVKGKSKLEKKIVAKERQIKRETEKAFKEYKRSRY